ncbi:MAG TPA: IPT/TIG domain-containing protein [Planctomycetota bacterium]|nr:IPT/TIG domain-containing protein [Planctomycetota bacterium]
MMQRSTALCGFLALAAPLAAQSFSYPDFSSVGTLSLLGNAAQMGSALRLTANLSNQTGWAWHQTAVPVLAGFDTTFSFRITPPPVGVKAEGLALVIHDDPNGLLTMGGTVWGMGYGNGANGATGIRNSIAIELDTYQDGFLGDTSANELTIHTRGSLGNHENEQYSIARNTPVVSLSNGAVHTLRVRYVPGQIEVFVDGSAAPAISRAYSLVTGGLYANNSAAPAPTLANGTAYAGFCATTGAGTLTELVEILSWTWDSTPLVAACYAGSIGQDVLTVGGSAGGSFRTVELATWQAFPIGLVPPSAFGPGAPYILFLSLAPNPGAPGTALGFGSMCMPVLPWGPTELVLADSFGIFAPVLPSAPAPYTIGIPAGVVTFPLDFTLQAVIASSLSPFELGVSNAVDVVVRPAPPPTIGGVFPLSAPVGQPITVTGTNFVPGSVLAVNGTPVATTSSSATQLVFAYPAGVPCGSQVTVLRPDGQTVSAALNPTPVVTGTILGSGTAAGGVFFLIQGSGFAPLSTVTIGGAAATVQTATSGSLGVYTPPGTPGVAQVVITTPGGCTTTTSYTYL